MTDKTTELARQADLAREKAAPKDEALVNLEADLAKQWPEGGRSGPALGPAVHPAEK